MRQSVIKQLDYGVTSAASLVFVGQYLRAMQPVLGRLVRSYLSRRSAARQGRRGQRQHVIENFGGDAFFKQSLSIALLPWSPTLRQPIDLAVPMIETLLSGQRLDYGVQPCGWLPLDVDTFAMGNGGIVKEGMGRTFAGVDGYCPLAA